MTACVCCGVISSSSFLHVSASPAVAGTDRGELGGVGSVSHLPCSPAIVFGASTSMKVGATAGGVRHSPSRAAK